MSRARAARYLYALYRGYGMPRIYSAQRAWEHSKW